MTIAIGLDVVCNHHNKTTCALHVSYDCQHIIIQYHQPEISLHSHSIMVKMLSAAGARNVESRVRSSERRSSGNNSNHISSSNNKERVEWSDDEAEAMPSHHHHHNHKNQHHGLRRSNTNNSSKECAQDHNADNKNSNRDKAERREQRPTLLARPRLGNAANKDKIHDKFSLIKQRSRNGMDSMKQRSKRGFDTVREHSAKVLPRRPNIRLKSAPNKDLPSRSLFRHEPRTWFGAKKEKADKVTEDWRNSRPTQSGAVSNSNISTKKEGAHRGREEVYHRKPSDQGRSSGRRSRSASRRRASFVEDDY